MTIKHVDVILTLDLDDVEWLESIYGEKWIKRMEQHIHNEVRLRRTDKDSALKLRKPWDY